MTYSAEPLNHIFCISSILTKSFSNKGGPYYLGSLGLVAKKEFTAVEFKLVDEKLMGGREAFS